MSIFVTLSQKPVCQGVRPPICVTTAVQSHERPCDLQSDPPAEGNVAETTIDELDPETLGAISYTFDMGDNWEHYIELQETREGSLDGDPIVVDEHGSAPPQYRDLDDEQ